MPDQPQDLSLGEGVSQFLQSLKSGQSEAQQHLAKFVRWFGQERPVAAITPADLEGYAGQVGSGTEGDGGRLKPIRDFLTYARKTGIVTENMAVHVKVRKSGKRGARSAARPVSESNPAHLTQEGYDHLKQRLAWLQEEMVRGAAEIKRAAADKDVRENAPLEAAREHLGQLAAQRREIEETLATAQVIQDDGRVVGEVRQGGTVTLEDVATGELQTWVLVDQREAAPLDGKLSTSSPVGQAVLGRVVGDEIEVSAPRGALRYKVLQAE